MSTLTVTQEQLYKAASRIAEWNYQTALGILVPYAPDNKAWFHEFFLFEVYTLLLRDNLISTIFPEGEMTLNKFIVYCHDKPIQILLAKREGINWPLAGFGWLYECSGRDGARRAKGGFVFFKDFWGTRTVRDLSWLLLNWWMLEMKIDVLYGTILASNRTALNFCRKFGFRQVGAGPGFFTSNGEMKDGVLVVLDRNSMIAAWDKEQERRGGEVRHG